VDGDLGDLEMFLRFTVYLLKEERKIGGDSIR